jgi:hypothetical protein
MLQEPQKGALPVALEEASHLEKSPAVQGFLAGLKGALFGAPAAGFIQAVRGKAPIPAAILGGLGAGLAMGLAKYLKQNVENVETESDIRWHAARIKQREPLFFMPPAQHMGSIFSKFHSRAHLPDAEN